MSEFELSIKSQPGGMGVVVRGDTTKIVVAFGMLAATIQKNIGLPLELLAAAVADADNVYEQLTKSCTTIDLSQLRHAGDKLSDD